jgi:putative peptidoglycan lipid II flippase
MSGWTLGYVVANQIVVLVVRNLARPGSGDATAYFDAYTFFVLPHGLLAMSIATTFTPELARAMARRDRQGFTMQASLGVRLIALLTIPAGIFLFVLRRPVIALFLQRGNYSPDDVLNTARALAGFALGLVGFSVYLFVLRGFYADQDTRTPFFVNLGQCALNIVLAVVLVDRYAVLGLSAAFAASYLIASLVALWVLRNRIPGFPLQAILVSVGRMAFAGVLGGEAMWFVARVVGDDAGAGALLRIIVPGVVGVAVYVGVLYALGAPELQAMRAGVAGRRRAAVR